MSLHKDLGGIQNDVNAAVQEARKFDTHNIVITGMYRFDYRDKSKVAKLCNQLNESGRQLKEEGIHLLCHNHNYEFQKVDEK